MERKTIEKILKLLLLALGLFEFCVATWMVFFPHHYKIVFQVAPETDPYYIRQTGWFLYFFVYFIFLGRHDLYKNLVAIQLVIIFRGTQSLFEAYHVLFLLKKSGLFFYCMIVFCAANILITAALIVLVKKLGLPWIDWKRKSPQENSHGKR